MVEGARRVQVVLQTSDGRGRIGVLLQTMTPALAEGLGISCERGAIVSDVIADSPAAQVGLRVGDVIVEVDGEPVDDVAQQLTTLRCPLGDGRWCCRSSGTVSSVS